MAIGNGKIEKKIDFEIWIEILKYVTKIWNEKIEIFIFEIWNENFCLIFFRNFGHITKWKWKNNWMKESYISFMPPR
jgi:hypothetical protein